MKLKKIKYNSKDGMLLAYTKEGKEPSDNEETIYTNDQNEPKESFVKAFQNLAKDMIRLTPFLQGMEEEELDIRSVRFVNREGALKAIVISACVDVGLNSPFNLSTPQIPIASEETETPCFYDEGGEARIQKLIDETVKFMKGNRHNKQLSLLDKDDNVDDLPQAS